MSRIPTTLGIDIGTSNVKVALVGWRPAARVLATVAAPTPTDADALLTVVAGAVRDCLAGAVGREPAGVRVDGTDRRPAATSIGHDGGAAEDFDVVPAAIGVSSQAETGVALDRSGRPLTQLIGWADGRARATQPELHAALAAAGLGPDDFFAATGVRVGPKPPLAIWHWFATREPALWARTRVWAGVGDLVVRGLTGVVATDHTLAGRTGALRLGARAFDAQLAGVGGLSPEQLPVLVAPGEAAGGVVPGAFADSLPVGTPVFAVGHDHAVGAYAAGVRAPGTCADSLGTAEAVYVITGPIAEALMPAIGRNGMSVVRTASGNSFAVVGGSPAAGGLVDWWCRVVRPGTRPEDVFDGADASAPSGTFVLPYPAGRQAPRPDPAARLEIRGLDGDARGGTLAEALLRGLVLQPRWIADEAYRLATRGVVGAPDDSGASSGPEPKVRTLTRTVALLGAPTRNHRWMERKVELTGWDCRIVGEADAVVVGAAMLAAERLGIPAEPLPATPLRSAPDPRADEIYAEFRAAAGGGA